MVPRLSYLSLRTRLLALSAVLVPMLALAAGAFYAERLVTGALDVVIKKSLDEMNVIMHVQKDLLILGVGADDVLLHHPHETRLDFDVQIRRVDDSVAKMLAVAFDSPEERQLAQDAVQKWREAQLLIPKIRALTDPLNQPQGDVYIHRFNGDIQRAAALLDEADQLAHLGIERSKIEAEEVLRRMRVLVISVVVAGLLMILATSVALARVLLRPLHILEDGARRIAEGQLAHRVILNKHDEAGRLAEAFNAMARQIERNQTVLAELVVHDSLTGLYNRREFERRLHEEIERATRYKHTLALLMLDIDDFKQINDRYGHQAGDEALCAVAAHLGDAVRPADHVARYGGEEFAILLPETDPDSAFALATRLCELIRTHSILLPEDQPITLTVSIGMAMYPDNAHSSDELTAAAYQALYAAKAAGRNQVVRQKRLAGYAPREHAAH
jgi:diguanylate cyclase (GGDEF)-like protein